MNHDTILATEETWFSAWFTAMKMGLEYLSSTIQKLFQNNYTIEAD